MNQKVRVAAVQAEPVWNDLEGGVQKVISIIEEAATNGAQVLGFPEVFIPGYPWSMYAKSPFENGGFMLEYMQNSMARDSPQMSRICAAVKKAGIFVVLGYSERDKCSMYISQAFISPSGEITHNRRKIKPTHIERAYWGTGEGDSLKTVIPTPLGKIGALNCWEHTQPLLRYHEYSQDVDIHVASWPAMWDAPESLKQQWSYQASGTMSRTISQTMAFEGACCVLVCSQVMRAENVGRNGVEGLKDLSLPGGGFSQIFGFEGEPLCEMLGGGEEGILYADVDLRGKLKAKQFLDLVGHYSRPDLLSLRADTRASRPVHYASESVE
ncbi:carbon-nitrogen hydrolase family protein [Aspergillus glaucus CBS 516.65]|uniref:nitrilase n=1 Tax=Aspergillus glaucus CBS 516.65 TaxID=1160497 RepID=A0A1L9VFI4_ASPGL|nr:hypothetical protein ASPGLDRAFT_48776 [Aspergillus glaucus CBS 516.65]OJJ82676.1 hypothetical protein ASPGLDRAFT_48776 [Aspergillus glaucus CBS 516.65]